MNSFLIFTDNIQFFNILLTAHSFIFTFFNYKNTIFASLYKPIKNNFKIGSVLACETLFTGIFVYHKQFLIGVCSLINKKRIMSNFLLRNVIDGILVRSLYFVLNNLVYLIRYSHKRFVKIGKACLEFIMDLPYLYRINNFVFREFKYKRRLKLFK